MKRIVMVDYIRLIASVFVVFLHCKFPGDFGIYIQALARFAVPFFFLVSGYFIYQDQPDIGRIKKLFFEHICMCLLMEFLSVLSLIDHGIDHIAANYFSISAIKRLAIGVYGSYGAGWFMYSLILCHIITLVFALLWKKNRNTAIVARKVLFVIAYLLLIAHLVVNVFFLQDIESDIYVSNFWMMGIPFYFIGMHIRSSFVENPNKSLMPVSISKVSIGMVVLGIIGTLIETHFFISDLYCGSVLLAIGLLLFAISYNSRLVKNRMEGGGGALHFAVVHSRI